MMGPGCDAAGGDVAGGLGDPKLEAIKGVLQQLLAVLGGDDNAMSDNGTAGEILEPGPDSGEGADDLAASPDDAGDGPGAPSAGPVDPKMKLLAMLKAKQQGQPA